MAWRVKRDDWLGRIDAFEAIERWFGSPDPAELAERYDAALAALAQPYCAVARAEVVGAIRRAAEFYRREGLVAQAERLERDPRLLPPEAPNPPAEPGNPGRD